MIMQNEDHYLQLSPADAKAKLIRLLQDAHAGERAAANAYWGHGYSLFVRDKQERAEILEIYQQEIHHRLRLREMLDDLGASPRPLREAGMYLIGFCIGLFCLFGGWFIPMYGAGKLESTNIVEYEVAARLAFMAGFPQLIDELLFFAEIEWDHEQYFYRKTITHPLHKAIKPWNRPPERGSIQFKFRTKYSIRAAADPERLPPPS